jgi:hypothetical protein
MYMPIFSKFLFFVSKNAKFYEQQGLYYKKMKPQAAFL